MDSPSFVCGELTRWIQGSGALEHASLQDFKRALQQQHVDITDHQVRRGLIYRLSLGGWKERPYGDHERVFVLRQTLHRASAQTRSRWLRVLWAAEQKDLQAPLIDAETDMAHHIMVISHASDDLKNTARIHRDF